MADQVGHTSEGCLLVLELCFNCKSFFSFFSGRLFADRPEFLVRPMLRTQPGYSRKNFVTRRWRDPHLHAGEISGASLRSV
ncbi:MAG TPA: hypothetical protein VGH39_00615, partial [Xanthobacteraceae bacterium]